MTRTIATRSLWPALGGLLIVAALVAACEEAEESSSLTPTPTAIVSETVEASPTSTPTPEPTPEPTQATPVATAMEPDLAALQQLADPAAKNLSMRELELNDETFGELAYDLQQRVASPGFGSQGGVTDMDRHYLEVYRWADGAWERAFSLYEFLPVIYPPEQLGSIVDDKPETATAVVTAELTLVQSEAEIGDVLFLQTGLMGGPEGVQHPAPTITALVWRDGELKVAYSEEFPVRGGMVWVQAEGEYVDLVMDAYLTTDPMCCPSGWEMLRLAPTEFGDLWPVARCTGPENHYCLSE